MIRNNFDNSDHEITAFWEIGYVYLNTAKTNR
jgi:hypothetical protein